MEDLNQNSKISPRLLSVLICGFLVLATVSVYWPVRHYEFVNFDDRKYVTANEHVREGLTAESVRWAFTTGHANFWHPLTWLSHMLDWELYGDNAGGHHFTSVLLHVANTLLLFFAVQRMTRATGRSAVVALLFALHPLHVESVAWVAERKDVLSAFFGLLALLAYIRHVEIQRNSTEMKTIAASARAVFHSRFLALALFFFALGLMAKPMLVTWPFVFLLFDVWPMRRISFGESAAGESKLIFARLVLEKIPFLILSAVASAVALSVQRAGGSVAADDFSVGARVANAFVSYCRYLWKAAWPENLAVFYPHPLHWPLWQVITSALLVVGLSAFAIFRWRRQPYIGVGWFLFLGILVPVIGLVQVGSHAMADRFTYLPAIGIFMALVWAFCDWTVKWKYGRSLRVALVVALVVLCARQSHFQVRQWQNSETLFRHAMQVTCNNDVACNNLGATLYEQGRLDEAYACLIAALKMSPRFNDTHVNLGRILKRQGKLEQAAVHFADALKMKGDDPETLNDLGNVLHVLGRTNEAKVMFTEALRLNPNFEGAEGNLADLLLEQGRLEEALKHYSAAARLNATNPAAHYGLAVVRMKQGNMDEAQAEYATTLRLDSQNVAAHNNLACILAARGQYDEAVKHFQQALQLKPDYLEALNNFGSTLNEMGQARKAEDYLKQALALNPAYADARHNLGNALAKQQRFSEAVAEYRKAIEINPAFAEAHYKLGSLLLKESNPDEAAREFFDAIKNRPHYAEAHYQLAMALMQKKEFLESARQLREALRLKPAWPEALNNLAWMLATNPDAQIRNGTEAVQLARRSIEAQQRKNPSSLDTLAAAYAEAGEWPSAVKAAEEALALAGDLTLAGQIKARLELYREKRPFRE